MKHAVILFLILFLFSISVTGKVIGKLDGYLVPDAIYMDDDFLYITEGPVISIHSLKDLSLLSRFGKSGEGPAEFKGRIFPDVSGPEILVSSQGRVSFFSKKGKFLREINPVTSGRFFVPLEGLSTFLGYYTGMNQEGIRISGVYIFDKDFKRMKPVYTYRSIVQSEKGEGWHLFAKTYINPFVCGSHIIVAGGTEFEIELFDPAGKPVKRIKRDYQRVPFTDLHKMKVLEHYRTNPDTAPEYDWWRKNIHFPDHFPAIRKIYTEKDRFYVSTFREKEGRHEFFMFSCSGDFIKQVFLKIYPSVLKNSYPYMRDSCPFVFRKGKIYQLVLDDETEAFELHVDEI